MDEQDARSFEQILEYLRQTRGFDFTAYKRASLMRRVLKRMHAVGAATFDAYLDYLQLHPDEFAALFNTILINVTSFFRDPQVWSCIDSVILPKLLEGRSASEPLRVWSAGCASGAEAYSLAMLLAERFGIEGVRDRAKIYATDVDEHALTEARQAVFAAKDLEDLPPGFADKYFSMRDDKAILNRDLRRAVMFGRLDLLQDAPISRIDLLLCRNTLMYFNSDAQSRVLRRLSYSVNGHGVLVLGRAELLFSHLTLFAPVDLKHRMFRVIAKAKHRDLARSRDSAERDIMPDGSTLHQRLRQAAFDTDAGAQLIVDAESILVSATLGARAQFGLKDDAIGRRLQELEVSYRPVDLRSAIDRVAADGRDVALRRVEHRVAGQLRFFDVTLSQVHDGSRAAIGVRITFADMTSFYRLQDELSASRQELETAYEELQSTNEELETTNEELQSTVEELETTNEELQSTNEELETMNEELHSTNAELQTMNDEMRVRTLDADAVNGYLASVFGSLRSAVVVLDREYRVKIWNRRAEDLWGIREGEAVGVPFLALDIGLPVGELAQPIRDVMNGERPLAEAAVTATTRRGKTIACAVSVTPLASTEPRDGGVIVLMDESSTA